jgi:hypothetical protein
MEVCCALIYHINAVTCISISCVYVKNCHFSKNGTFLGFIYKKIKKNTKKTIKKKTLNKISWSFLLRAPLLE